MGKGREKKRSFQFYYVMKLRSQHPRFEPVTSKDRSRCVRICLSILAELC